ncbi:hypothetical protein NAU58_18175 [Pseudomonas stutzeri]|uniref:Uncharacterized protein n=1 Tax=Stutzerimonas stutzeri TaxID=316 RepID=A0A2N8RZ31_STUST|nr:hypothetical protein [Stutzerimonas stutzeri]MCQ4297509.1 hypothetical protein [Stutzerimonas stutzeri]PNF79645.1 hypothetical protein CXK92_13435 [Stutzerimonas stutzeri]
MSYNGNERRKYPSLRKHVEALLNAGATITEREPLQLLFKGQEMGVRHGILLCEPTPQELDEALSLLANGDSERRTEALTICLKQLEAAIAPYPPFHTARLSKPGNTAAIG